MTQFDYLVCLFLLTARFFPRKKATTRFVLGLTGDRLVRLNRGSAGGWSLEGSAGEVRTWRHHLALGKGARLLPLQARSHRCLVVGTTTRGFQCGGVSFFPGPFAMVFDVRTGNLVAELSIHRTAGRCSPKQAEWQSNQLVLQWLEADHSFTVCATLNPVAPIPSSELALRRTNPDLVEDPEFTDSESTMYFIPDNGNGTPADPGGSNDDPDQ